MSPSILEQGSWLVDVRTDVSVVTGCNSGIGLEFAKILNREVCRIFPPVHWPYFRCLKVLPRRCTVTENLSQGYDVYALDQTLGDKLRSLEGPKCEIGRLDVTDVKSIEGFKNSLGDQKVDILLNIAGKSTYRIFGPIG